MIDRSGVRKKSIEDEGQPSPSSNRPSCTTIYPKSHRSAVRNRLLSIRYDVENHCQPMIEKFLRKRQFNDTHPSDSEERPIAPSLVVVANERCGTWYADPYRAPNRTGSGTTNTTTCCFKSTDGHYGTWNFSLKRLNLNILRLFSESLTSTDNDSHLDFRYAASTPTSPVVALNTSTVVMLLDASTSKSMPDSFSRTIPIWAAVMNRIAIRYRQEYHLPPYEYDQDDENSFLWTPEGIVTEEEFEMIQQRIPVLVDTLYHSRAIVDPQWLATTLRKPLRPFWMVPSTTTITYDDLDAPMRENYFSIFCMSCSDVTKKGQLIPRFSTNDKDHTPESYFTYIPGAADDHESWAPKHLTPDRFWRNGGIRKNRSSIDDDNNDTRLDLTASSQDPDGIVALDDRILDSILQKEGRSHAEDGCFHEIGQDCLRLYIGTRSVGRPPMCWLKFDAILNVTEVEYDNMTDHCRPSHGTVPEKRRYYLQLPVREGKRDRTELEKYMTLGILFILVHTKQNRNVLVHCAQGMDRSVAVVMAFVAIFTTNTYPPQWNEHYHSLTINRLVEEDDNNDTDNLKHNPSVSGLSKEVFQSMLGRDGRDRLFDRIWPRCRNDLNTGIINKESLRITLQLVRHYHDRANPSRATIQKLHRYFCST